MRKLFLLTGVAAMAATMPALAQGRGGGHGKGGGNPQIEARGGGHQGHARGNGRGERRPQAQRTDHGGHGRGGGRAEIRAERGGGHGRAQIRAAERRQVRDAQRAERRVERDVRRSEQREIRAARRVEDRDWNGWLSRRGRGDDSRFADRSAFFREGRPLPVSASRGGCPPGLAKQNAFCLPPGQLRRAQLIGQRIDRSRFGPVPEDWLFRFRDDDDFYYLYDDDGYIYRVERDGDLISSILPLFGSGLTIGEPLPLGYDVYNLPVPYRDYYMDDDDWLYRYDDGAIYRVDNETRMIESIVALLTGNPITVGQPLPTGYDVYNLPFDYRDRYVDDADSLYRYSNGGIYQVDPTTMLVQALVEMIL